MTDIRDLICRAERLQAQGFTRRAATAWRDIATHPETPEKMRAAIWKRIDTENGYHFNGTGGSTADPEKHARNLAICAALNAGMTHQQAALKFGVSRDVVSNARRRSGDAGRNAKDLH